MTKNTITLTKSVLNGEAKVEGIILNDMTAGDYFDAAREAPENASRAELEARVAAKCAGLPFAVIRQLSMVDYKKVSDWYDAQWAITGAAPVGGDPLVDGAKPLS